MTYVEWTKKYIAGTVHMHNHQAVGDNSEFALRLSNSGIFFWPTLRPGRRLGAGSWVVAAVCPPQEVAVHGSHGKAGRGTEAVDSFDT